VDPIPPRIRARRRRRAGYALIYVSIALVAFTGICALAVDWGRVQLAKTELRRTCDAAARYAITGVSDGTALAKANWIAGQNPVDGRPIAFTATEVETGIWDPASLQFTPGGTGANAVRLTARRRVPAVFGQISGPASTQLTVQAVVRYNIVGMGVVGLNGISMGGNSTISYWSGGGPGITNKGNIGSNGNITLGGSSTVNGDVYYLPGNTVSGTVTGSRIPLGAPLSYPPGDAGIYASFNDNWQVPNSYWGPGGELNVGKNQSLTLPGGHYYIHDLNLSASGSLTFTGPATLFVYHNVSLGGSAVTSGSTPANLSIVMVPDPGGRGLGTVTISSNSALYASIYAPQNAVTLSGSGDIYGSVLGQSINMTGSSNIHYDLSLNAQNGSIALVQ
jgi:Flp pilus assembly protein TadG